MPSQPPASSQASDAVLRAGFAISGMNCSNCARHVGEAIRSVSAVVDVHVELGAARAQVRWRSAAEADPAAVIQAVRSAGFGASLLPSPQSPEVAAGIRRAVWGRSLLLGALLTFPLMLGEWVFGWGHEPWFRWLALAASGLVLACCGGRFYAGAWGQLKRGASNMDTLVSLGASAAFGFSLVALLTGRPGHLYFMEAAAIVTLISAGHFLEAAAAAKAVRTIRGLLQLAPAIARKVTTDGEMQEVPATELRPGDLVELRPGDRVPADGQVREGGSAVDESMLTGESLASEKGPGDIVVAGTINLSGRLLVRVDAVGEATALSQIIAVVQRAQSSRAQIQRLADRVSAVFVPAVVLLALATALAWWLAYPTLHAVSLALGRYLWMPELNDGWFSAGIVHAVSVLIVACPCALGLATPIAIIAGTNAAARRGILIRDGTALEKTGCLTDVVFDKTGTLTAGTLRVIEAQVVRSGQPLLAPEELEVLASLAWLSQHPASRAVAKWAGGQGGGAPNGSSGWDGFREIAGHGLEARRGVSVYRLGSIAWLVSLEVNVSAAAGFLERWLAEGGTVVGFAVDGQLASVFALLDSLKPGVAGVVRNLECLGLKVHLVTGDRDIAARTVARAAGIPEANVFAGVLPVGKGEAIRGLQGRGAKVAFVGDGINDAPALAMADLGIAVSRATDVAREAADMILIRADVEGIPEALAIARATLRTIRQNLFWAFFYNVAAIPLAALGLLSPIVCAVAMGASDLIVVGNALRLSGRRRGFSLPAGHPRPRRI